MARPKKKRNLNHELICNEFVPLTIVCLHSIVLDKDEIEAIKLHDLLDLDQNMCAEKMQISQSTFHRILLSSRKKVADALISVKSIRINN